MFGLITELENIQEDMPASDISLITEGCIFDIISFIGKDEICVKYDDNILLYVADLIDNHVRDNRCAGSINGTDGVVQSALLKLSKEIRVFLECGD